MALLTLGTGLYINFSANTSLAQIFGFEIIAGIGAGLVFEPPLIALQALVKQDDVASATATLGFVRNLATSISVVVGGVVLQNGMDEQQTGLRSAGLPESLVASFSGRSAVGNIDLIGKVSDAAWRGRIEAAFADSMRDIWILNTAVCAVGFVATVFISKAVLSKEHTETKTGIREKEEVR